METAHPPLNRILLRCVLKDISPLVARVFSVPDDLEIWDLHDVFMAMLDWDYSPDFIIRIHAQEFASFRRNSRGKRLITKAKAMFYFFTFPVAPKANERLARINPLLSGTFGRFIEILLKFYHRQAA